MSLSFVISPKIRAAPKRGEAVFPNHQRCYITMGNAHVVHLRPPSCARIVKSIRRRREDARGAFPTFEDGSFAANVPRSTNSSFHLRREQRSRRSRSRRFRDSMPRLKTFGRRNRIHLDTVSESEEEETVSFYKPFEKDDFGGMQEDIWRAVDHRGPGWPSRRRLDTLSESEEEEASSCCRFTNENDIAKLHKSSAWKVPDRKREHGRVRFLV